MWCCCLAADQRILQKGIKGTAVRPLLLHLGRPHRRSSCNAEATVKRQIWRGAPVSAAGCTEKREGLSVPWTMNWVAFRERATRATIATQRTSTKILGHFLLGADEFELHQRARILPVEHLQRCPSTTRPRKLEVGKELNLHSSEQGCHLCFSQT